MGDKVGRKGVTLGQTTGAASSGGLIVGRDELVLVRLGYRRCATDQKQTKQQTQSFHADSSFLSVSIDLPKTKKRW